MDDGNVIPGGSTAPDKKDGEPGLKYTVTERIIRLLQLLLTQECTRLEIFECLSVYNRVDENDVGRASSSRRVDRMLERDIKLLEELKFEIGKVQAKVKLVILRGVTFILDN